MEILVLIVFAVVSVLWYTFTFKSFAVRLDMHLIEFIWTLIPTFALVLIGLPSIWRLYFMEEEFSQRGLTEVGVVGKQWFWEFYFRDRNFVEELVDGSISSYYLEGGDEDFRTLETDSIVSIPQGVTCFNVTSNDVIHSFACPALGIKIDAVPGKCNSFFSSILQPGIFFGSCAEICGVNHSFMPFCILVYRRDVLEYFDSFFSDLHFFNILLNNSINEEIICEINSVELESSEISKEVEAVRSILWLSETLQALNSKKSVLESQIASLESVKSELDMKIDSMDDEGDDSRESFFEELGRRNEEGSNTSAVENVEVEN